MAGPSLFRPDNIPTGLQGYWKLDEASGTRFDSSSNGNDLTDNNTVGSTTEDYWSTAEDSASFVAASMQYLSITDAAQTGLGFTGDFSVAFWCKASDVSGIIYYVNKLTPGGWLVYVTAGTLKAGVDTNFANIGDPLTFPENKWTHVAFTFNNTTKVGVGYVDGNKQLASTAFTSSPTTNSTDFKLVGNPGTGDYGDTLMKDAACWNVVLTPLQIKSLAMGVDLSTSAYRPSNIDTTPTSYWKLNELSGNAVDSEGSHTGTDFNTVSSREGFAEAVGRKFTAGNSERFDITNSTDFDIGAGDFAWCSWVKADVLPSSNQATALFANRSSSNGWNIAMRTSGSGITQIEVHGNGSTITANLGGTSSIVDKAGHWYHLAVTRSGDDWRIYIDGELNRVVTNSITINAHASAQKIGHIDQTQGGDAAVYFDGKLSDMAFWKGYALTDEEIKLLASSFPIQQSGIVSYWPLDEQRLALTLAAVGDAQIDTAQSALAASTSSLLLDGTGDYVNIVNTPDFGDFGAGEFCVEGWFRFNSVGAAQYFWMHGDNTSSGEWTLSWDTVNLQWVGSAPTNTLSAAWSPATNTWYHIACERYEGILTVYVDGTALFSGTDTRIYENNGDTHRLGVNPSGTGQYFNGWMDELRTSSVARYKGAFAVPTVPFVTDASTSMLLHFEGIDGQTYFIDSSNERLSKTVSVNGNADIDAVTTDAFGGTAGIATFDGTGDYLTLLDSPDWDFGTGDFTIDCWFKHASTSGTQIIIDRGNETDFQIVSDDGAGGQIIARVGGGAMIRAWGARDTSWHHIAFIRVSGVARIFIDGTQLGADATLAGSVASTNFVTIGGRTSLGFFNGHIDELRISKGVARWTSNFTPPTSAFTTDDVTVLLLHMDGTDGSVVFTDSAADGEQPAVRLDSIGSNDLTDFNTVAPVVGKVGAAAQFIAANTEYLEGTDASLAAFNTSGQLTVITWNKPATLASYQYIAYLGDGGGTVYNGFLLRYVSTGQINFTVGNSTELTSAVGFAIPIGKWGHVAGVWDGAQKQLYVDSAESVAAAAHTVAPTQSGNHYLMGRFYNAGGDYLNGMNDEQLIATRWFRPEEIKSVYVKGLNDLSVDSSPIEVSANTSTGFFTIL